jgi:hypothetical protein
MPPWIRPVLTLWVFRAGAGLVVSYPAARTLSSFGPASPEGDALLFAAGGLHLMEALRLGGRALGAAVESASAVGLLVAFVGLLPLAAALAMLASPHAGARAAASRAVETWPALVLLGGGSVLAQAAVAALSSAALSKASDVVGALTNERNADLLLLATGAAAALVVLAIGLLQDLARAAMVRDRLGASDAVVAGLRALLARPAAVAGAWLGPSALGGVVVLGGAWAVSAVDVSRPSGARVAAVLVLHQAAALALAGLRVRWLTRSLALVPRAEPGGTTAPDEP